MKSPANLEELLGAPADFVPFACYDKHMDLIRVELRDCSLTEVRVSPQLTVLLDNDPAPHQDEVAGITIKGVSAIFAEWGIALEGAVYVTDLIDRVLGQMPEDPENRACDINENNIRQFTRVAANIELKVNFDENLALAA